MSRPSLRLPLPDLRMPLRDALRGAASLAESTEAMLEPAARVLPDELRAGFRGAISSLERAGRRLARPPVTAADVAAAARHLRGEGDTVGHEGAAALATVFVFAWDRLDTRRGAPRAPLSETILTERLCRTRPTAGPAGPERAAARLVELRRLVAAAPGMHAGPARDLAILAIGVWLLTGRAGSVREETILLDLSFGLIRALGPDAAALFLEPDTLTEFLDQTARHL